MAKTVFYVVSFKTPHSEFNEEMVFTRVELVSFLRKGCKFISIRLLERPDFNNPNLFDEEHCNAEH